MSERPDISVIIPAYNEERFLPRCIASLRRAAECYRRERGGTIEIIVVDNNSTDRTAQVARELGARLVEEPINNIARARNAGARVARGRFLAFCDADNEVNERLLCEIHDHLSRGDVIGGGTRLKPERFTFTVAVYFSVWKVFQWLGRLGVGVMHCRREDFEAVGGFDAGIYAGEDVDFAYRLKRLGQPRGQRFRMLRRAWVVTSMRKVEHFSFWHITREMLRFIPNIKARVRDKRYCGLWYEVKR
jgi:glycosyltransferase involved in cell wall biosynthesis